MVQVADGVGNTSGVLGSYELAQEGSRGHWSLWTDEEGADLPNSGGGEGIEQKGTCLGSGMDSRGVPSI